MTMREYAEYLRHIGLTLADVFPQLFGFPGPEDPIRKLVKRLRKKGWSEEKIVNWIAKHGLA